MTEPKLHNIMRLQMAVGMAALYLRDILPESSDKNELAAEMVALHDITGKWLRGEYTLVESGDFDARTKARIETIAVADQWRELAKKARAYIAKRRAPKNGAKPRRQVLAALNQAIQACPVVRRASA